MLRIIIMYISSKWQASMTPKGTREHTFITLVGGQAQALTATVHSAGTREAVRDVLTHGQVAVTSLGARELAVGLGSVGTVVALRAWVQLIVGDVGWAEIAGGTGEAL